MGKAIKKRVLIVDEEKSHQFLYSLKLKQSGFEVGFAENALQATQALSSGIRFDLIVSDYDLPKMSGIDLHKHLTTQNYSIPFILMSEDPKKVSEAYGNTWSDENVLAKPIDYDQMVELINQKLNQAS